MNTYLHEHRHIILLTILDKYETKNVKDLHKIAARIGNERDLFAKACTSQSVK